MGRITETIRCMVRLANSAILEVAIRWNSTFSRLTDALKIEQPKRASGRSFASVVTRKRPSLNRAGIGAWFKSGLRLRVAGVDARRATPPDPRPPRWGLAG